MADNTDAETRELRADARRNRDLVLAAAREALSANGSSVPFTEIAQRANVGVGTVYRHFPTRRALFEAVILGRIEEFVARARVLASDDTDPGKAFLGYFTNLMGEMSLNQALCDALEVDTGLGFAAPEDLQQEFLQALETLLQRAQDAGKVRTELDVADVVDLLIGSAAAVRRAHLRGAASRLVALMSSVLRPGTAP